MQITTKTAKANHLIEIKFDSTSDYSNPFFDINLDVSFSDPSGKKLTVPAFWTGGHIWAVRYSSTIVGKHTYITSCNDCSNTNLHKVTGFVEITPYDEDNSLLIHGAPKVSADNHHFCHADETPFFWLGDTWWLGLTKRLGWPDDFKILTEDRKKKGFTVIQLVAGLYPDMAAFDPKGISEHGFPWECDFKTINPSFFDEADQRILHLVSQGIVPCILGAWGYYLKWLGIEKMQLHWRYIMARWGALPVIWIAAGEQTMPWYLSNNRENESQWLKEEWSKVIQYMHDINGFNRIISTHPIKSARDSVIKANLVDFEMQQTGHRSRTTSQAKKALKGWQTNPPMPVISGESRYEGLDIIPKVTTADSREAFWAHLLNSGCAGHTYGANGIWQVNLEGNPFGNSPNGHNWGNIPWKKAMHSPGSTHMSLAIKMLETLPWHTLHADVQKQPKWDKLDQWLSNFVRYQKPVSAAKSPKCHLFISYFLNLKSVKINTHAYQFPMNGFWFDPTDGRIYQIFSAKLFNGENLKIRPPGRNAANDKDWVLILSKEN